MSHMTTIIALGVLFSIMLGCRKADTVDYYVRFDYVFVNETNHDIKDFGGVFPILAGETKIHILDGLGGKFAYFRMIPGEVPGIYFDRLNEHRFRYELSGAQPVELIRFDDEHCFFVMESNPSGPYILDNFEKARAGDRHLIFTYRITESLFEESESCDPEEI